MDIITSTLEMDIGSTGYTDELNTYNELEGLSIFISCTIFKNHASTLSQKVYAKVPKLQLYLCTHAF